ncbi:MAG: ribonuclease H-like domain-containing protein [bacterium]|nr:ribonuclease H-like domain-containing protein [bacterium]
MKREFKGHILHEIPLDYVILDIKTTGADPYYDSITSIEAAYYLNDEEIEQFSETFTGSEADKLIILKHLQQFIGRRPLIGYSIEFTIDFLYDAFHTYLEAPLSNDYLDLKEVLRKTKRLQGNYTLSAVCKGLKLPKKQDIKETEILLILQVFDYIRNEVVHNKKVDYCTPLEDRRCVFTGKLQRLGPKEASQLLIQNGGTKEDRVTRKTNYLILGNHDYCSNIEEGKSNKQRKAEVLKQQGYDIEILSENVFYDLIYEKGTRHGTSH